MLFDETDPKHEKSNEHDNTWHWTKHINTFKNWIN